MRFDLQTLDYVQPETWRRIHDEGLTYMAEGINRPLYTEFNLKEVNGNLTYFDRGQWRPYMGMLTTGMETARREAAADPRKTFQADRAASDWLIGQKLHQIEPGGKLSWQSAYPEQEELLYGAAFIKSLGYQPARKMGFLYQAVKNPDNSVTLFTQSVDNSDNDAFDAARRIAEQDESADIHDLRERYDAALACKHQDDFFAGRSRRDKIPEENAWEIIKKHGDLTAYYFEKMEALARDDSTPRADLERSVKRLTYGVWAALKQRLDNQSLHINPETSQNPLAARLQLRLEVSRSYRILAERGEEILGCGGGISAEDALLEANSEDVFDAIFEKDEEDRYGSLKFKCEKGHTNKRPRNQLIDSCKTCGVSVRC